METNRAALENRIKTDRHLVFLENKILGKVVWTHLNLGNGLFEVGVRFVHPREKNQKEIESILREA